MDEHQLPDISDEGIMALLGLDIETGPRIPPQFESDIFPRVFRFHKVIGWLFVVLRQHFVLYVLPCLIPIALAQRVYALHKLRKVYDKEKGKGTGLSEEQKRKEALGLGRRVAK